MKTPCAALLLLLSWLGSSCKREYELPPLKQVNENARLSISGIRARIAPGTSSSWYRFGAGDTNLYCTVTCDESSRNFYREVFVTDEHGGALQINLKESGGLYVGDLIRINLNHLRLVSANGMLYLDSVDVYRQVVKLSSGHPVTAKPVSMQEILSYSNSPSSAGSLQSQLVELREVVFLANPLHPTFADAIGRSSVNQTLRCCESGQTLTLRSNGRANFAGTRLPSGRGRITGIVGQFHTTMQLMIRDIKDVDMKAPPCTGRETEPGKTHFLIKDFNDRNLRSGGWTLRSVINSQVSWQIGLGGGNPDAYARVSGYLQGNTLSENWLISPPLDLRDAGDPVLSFRTAAKFPGPALRIMICTDGASVAPEQEIWIPLTHPYALSPVSGDYMWTFSGYIPLGDHRQTGFRLAFQYRSEASGASTYLLDDIVIRER
jgi:hypothetical protein